MAAHTAPNSHLKTSTVAPRRWIMAEATSATSHGRSDNSSAHLVRRDEPCHWSIVAIVAIICALVILISAVLIYKMHRHRSRSEQVHDQANKQEPKKLQERDISTARNTEPTQAYPPINWEWEFRRARNRIEDLEAGGCSPCLRPDADLGEPANGEQNDTEQYFFIVGSSEDEDEEEIHSPVVADISTAKAMPIRNVHDDLKAVDITMANESSYDLASSNLQRAGSDEDGHDIQHAGVEKLPESGEGRSP